MQDRNPEDSADESKTRPNRGACPEVMANEHNYKHYSQWYEETFRSNAFTRYYAFTVTSNYPLTRHTYILYLETLTTVCKNVTGYWMVYEKSKHGKLHLHGYVASNGESKFLKIKKHNLIHTHTKPVFNRSGWFKYSCKSKPLNPIYWIKPGQEIKHIPINTNHANQIETDSE